MIPLAKSRYYLSDQGIQEKSSPLLITPQQLQIAKNVHFYEAGSWTKRAGYIKRFTNDLSGTPIITGLYNFIKRDGTSYFITSADVLYKGSQGDTSAVAITGGLSFTTGTNGENFMSFITFNNKAIGVNGVEPMWGFNGTTAANIAGSPPLTKMIAVFHSFVFVAGNPTYPYRLYFSNDGNETVWTGTDYLDIGDLTSQITGLAVLFGKLVIFTRRGMYQLSGYDRDTFSLEEIQLSTGCVAHKSVVKVDNNLVFLSDRGIYSFDGINVHYLSETVEPTIGDLNYSRIGQVVAELYKAKNQVWFSCSNGSNSQNNQVLCMTYKPKLSEASGLTNVAYLQEVNNVSFAIYTGMAFNALGLERSSTQMDRLYAGNYAGRITQQDIGTNDDGAGIDFQVKTPPISMENPEEFKRFRYMWLFVKQEGNYGVDINYSTDFGLGGTTTTMNLLGEGASTWGSMVWGVDVWGGATMIRKRVSFKSEGHYIELTFINSNADQPIVIRGFTMLAQLKGISR